MKTRNKWSKKNPLVKKIWIAVVVIFMLLFSQHAFASTAANTTITNTVTVTYFNTAGIQQPDETATASFRVLLVAAPPTLDSPASIDPSTENTLNVLTYTIYSNANGEDSYTISTGNGNDANLSAASLVVNGGAASNGDPVNGANITLGGTTLAADAPIGATQITVPYDSNVDGDILYTNGITSGDTIIIGGNPYVVDVNGITEDSVNNVTTIDLDPAVPIAGTPGNIGEVVGQQDTFSVNVTTGALSSGASGNHTLSTTVASVAVPTESTTQVTATVITVRRPLLSVVKYVQNIDSPVVGGGLSTGLLDTGSGAGPLNYYSQNVTGVPGEELEYVIVVQNPAGGGSALDVVIEDQIPQFTSYVADSMLLDPGTGTFGGVTDIATDTDKGEYDNTSGNETVWIYAGSGGGDTGTAGNFGDGTGGSMNGGETTRGVFRVTID